ncbi:MAG TPA: MetS family NSS transporter small subunit [bacterium]|nr:MetS family NSS transporter small subunit [bacterium]
METDAVLMMMLSLGLIWGGFFYTLRLAIKKEQLKQQLNKHEKIS